MRISLSLELLDVNMLQRARFDFLFFPVGGGPVYVLKLSILRVCVWLIKFSGFLSLPLSARFV